MKLIPACFALLFSFLLISCAREKEVFDDRDFKSSRITELYTLQTGKYIIYRLDSIVLTNLGRKMEVRSYRIKDEVAEPVTDNLGRPGYKIVRSITDSGGLTPWTPITTYYVTPLQDRIEVVEYNKRIVKLQVPLKLDATWKGNRHLPFAAYGEYSDQRFNEVNLWEFSYADVNKDTIGSYELDSVWTVRQFNEVADTASTPETVLYGIGYVEEKYARHIGMVSKEFILLENEPNQIGVDTYDPYKIGFGIKMWMIDHN